MYVLRSKLRVEAFFLSRILCLDTSLIMIITSFYMLFFLIIRDSQNKNHNIKKPLFYILAYVIKSQELSFYMYEYLILKRKKFISNNQYA